MENNQNKRMPRPGNPFHCRPGNPFHIDPNIGVNGYIRPDENKPNPFEVMSEIIEDCWAKNRPISKGERNAIAQMHFDERERCGRNWCIAMAKGDEAAIRINRAAKAEHQFAGSIIYHRQYDPTGDGGKTSRAQQKAVNAAKLADEYNAADETPSPYAEFTFGPGH
jgi:hypothetical protein